MITIVPIFPNQSRIAVGTHLIQTMVETTPANALNMFPIHFNSETEQMIRKMPNDTCVTVITFRENVYPEVIITAESLDKLLKDIAIDQEIPF